MQRFALPIVLGLILLFASKAIFYPASKADFSQQSPDPQIKRGISLHSNTLEGEEDDAKASELAFGVSFGGETSEEDDYDEAEEEDAEALARAAANDRSEEARYKELLAEQGENATAVEPAPRTFAGEYNAMAVGEKCFIYSPSGGMGNQLVELINGCHLAKVMNRTLLVPMLGSHSSMYWGYERLPPEGLFPMDRILDFPHLSQYCKVIPVNVSVVNFVKMQPAHVVFEIFHAQRKYWHVKDMVNAVEPHREKKIVYMHGSAMYHRWMEVSIYRQVMQFVRFSPYLRWRAMEIVRQAFPPDGKFNAMHVRLGDYISRWPEDVNARGRMIWHISNKHPEKDNKLPMYLASDEPNSQNFHLLRQRRNVVSINMLPRKLMREYALMFSSKFRLDMEGVLDQLICSQARDFIPTVWSSFSQGILAIRSNKANLFPEIAKQ